MTFMVTEPPAETVTLDAWAFPVEIAKEMMKLARYLEVPRDVVVYHEAEAKLKGLIVSLQDYHDIAYPDPVAQEWSQYQVYNTIMRFVIRHQHSMTNREELAHQLLSVIHYFPRSK